MPERIDNNVVLLLHLDGVDASTVISDSSIAPHTVTAVNSAQIDTAQSVFGDASGLLSTVTTDYINSPSSADWDFGNGDFTIDLRVRFSDVTDINQGFLRNSGGSGNEGWVFAINTNLVFYVNGNTITISKAWSPSVDTWYHIAVVRNGNTMELFVDGTSLGTATYSGTITDSTNELRIGSGSSFSTSWLSESLFYFSGWIDEVRVNKGIARWTSNFTPPIRAYGSGDAAMTLPSPTVSSTTPAADIAITLPVFSVAGYTAAIGSTTLPLLSISSESKNHSDSSLTLPSFTIDAVPPPSTITLPIFTVSAEETQKGSATISLPIFSVQSARTNHCNGFIAIPQLSTEFEGLSGIVEGISLSMPRFCFSIRSGLTTSLLLPQLDIAGIGYSGIKGDYGKSLPRMTVNVKATQHEVGSYDVSLPAFSLYGICLTGEISLASTRNLSGLQVNAHGFTGLNGDGAMSLPALSLSANPFQSLEASATLTIGMITLDAYADSYVNRII